LREQDITLYRYRRLSPSVPIIHPVHLGTSSLSGCSSSLVSAGREEGKLERNDMKVDPELSATPKPRHGGVPATAKFTADCSA